jgi:hypothetical protein
MTARPPAGPAENATLSQRIRDLTAGQRTLEERLQGARSNNRFLDKRIVGLEAGAGPAGAGRARRRLTGSATGMCLNRGSLAEP